MIISLEDPLNYQLFEKWANGIALVTFGIVVFFFLFQSFIPVNDSFYLVAITFLLLLVIDHVVGIQRQAHGQTIKIYQNDIEALKAISRHISEQDVKSVDILQYSGLTITNMMRELLKTDCKIRLLLFDPRQTEDETQRQRIRDSYVTKKMEFKAKDKEQNLEIAFYDTHASLRGLNFDDRYLSVGWLVSSKVISDGKTKAEVVGHSNPVTNTYTSTDDGARLLRFFKDHFSKLWERRILSDDVEGWWSKNAP